MNVWGFKCGTVDIRLDHEEAQTLHNFLYDNSNLASIKLNQLEGSLRLALDKKGED